MSEHRRVSVPVVNEEVNLDREPTNDAHRSAAYDPPAISVRKPDVVLREERPVVDIEAVPEERVRLGTETHPEQETVGGEVPNAATKVDADDPNVRGR